MWGGSPFTRILDRVEAKAFRLIDDARLTSSLDSLSLRRRVASLTMFYKIYFAFCSSELRSIIPPPLPRPLPFLPTGSQFSLSLFMHLVRAKSQAFLGKA